MRMSCIQRMGSITDPERLYLSLPVISTWKEVFGDQKLAPGSR